MRIEWPEIRAQVASYCRTKIEEQNQPNWIAVGEGASGGLFVIVIEHAPEQPLVDVFVQPSAPRHDALLTDSDREFEIAGTDLLGPLTETS
jgi:hypothetical protein